MGVSYSAKETTLDPGQKHAGMTHLFAPNTQHLTPIT